MNKKIEATHGEYEVPTARTTPIFLGDSHHSGTVVWKDAENDTYWFACAEVGIDHCNRILLLEGGSFQTVIPQEIPYAVNLDGRMGVWLIGVNDLTTEDPLWLAQDQKLRILWDSEDEA